MTHRLVCAFHPSGQSFAIVSHDQRLKIFSTLTHQLQQDLTEAQHLTSTITCIAYPAAAAKSASATSSLIALGTKSGEILLWNTKKGVLEHKLGVTTAQQEKHQAAVTSLAFSPTGGFLFSTSADKTLKQWSVTSGACIARFTAGSSEDAAAVVYSRCAVSPDGSLLVAGGSGALTLWSLTAPSLPLREYSGATANISTVGFSPDGKLVASANVGERHISVWNAETAEDEQAPTAKKSKKEKKSTAANRTTAIQTITLQTPPLSLQFNPFTATATAASSKQSATYQLAALSDSSIATIVQFSTAASGSPVAAAVQVTLTIPSSSGQSEAAKRREHAYNAAGKNNKHRSTAASSTLLAGSEGDAIGSGAIQAIQFESATAVQLARGDAVRPMFEKTTFRKADAAQLETAQIVLGKYAPQALMTTPGNAATATTGAAALTDKATAGAKRKAASAANEAVTLGAQHTGDRLLSASEELDGGGSSSGERATKKAKLLKSKSDTLSRSLAERLAESDGAMQRGVTLGGASFNLETGELPKAGSLQTILQQALHSNDTALVEYCLTAGAAQLASNSTLIRSTVRRLSPVYVLPLLQHLMSKFASRPNRSAALLPWLREVFKNHTAYLIRQPQLTHKLAPLYHLLDTRLSVFKKLLKLQGRLELLLSQISAAKNPGAADDDQGDDADQPANAGPINTFNDGEGEEEENDDQDDEEDDQEEEEEDEDEQMDGSEGDEEEADEMDEEDDE